MQLSMKTEYALRALYELARAPGIVSRSEIAERQDIPLPFLEQILIHLKEAGLIQSRPGPGGGFSLAKPKEEITLWDIYQAVESDPQFKQEQCFPALKTPCERLAICKIKKVWFQVNETIRKTMSSFNLKNLAEDLP